MDGNKKSMRSLSRMICALGILYSAIALFAPDMALATTISFNVFIEALNDIVSKLLLPIAIIICISKVVYIALVPGLMGADPFHLITDTNGDGQVSFQEAKLALMGHLGGMVKGLVWIACLFIIFKLVIGLATGFAGVFSQAFA